MPKKKEEVLLPTLVTIAEYAEHKGIIRAHVYKAIENKNISVVLVGKYPKQFIDFEKYKDYEFKYSSRRRK